MSEWQEELRANADFRTSVKNSAVAQKYRVRVPQYYLNLIDESDPRDPIALMALPQNEELFYLNKTLRDPIGDLTYQVAPRLTHRYPDRALIHTTNLCPMYCRFCFRKNLMNEVEPELYIGEFDAAFSYLRAHSEIKELIFSGGDPLMLSDARLKELLDRIESELPHIERVRFHTRMPVTLPSRITKELLSTFLGSSAARPWQIFVVTHFNHPREITKEASTAIALLKAASITVLNQSVLLKDVNNSVEILKELFVGLGRIGVIPYYLHHCDLVAGADHFRTSIEEGKKIWMSLRGKIPGYLLPEYVMEVPGGGGKVPVLSDFVNEVGVGQYEIYFNEKRVSYRDPVI